MPIILVNNLDYESSYLIFYLHLNSFILAFYSLSSVWLYLYYGVVLTLLNFKLTWTCK